MTNNFDFNDNFIDEYQDCCADYGDQSAPVFEIPLHECGKSGKSIRQINSANLCNKFEYI